MSELVEKRLRWLVVMRHMRPWGHVGLLFTQGLAWSIAAVVLCSTLPVIVSYFGLYLALRVAMTAMIGVWGLRRREIWKSVPLIVAWDAVAFAMWLVSFVRNTVRWRGGEYYIRDGMLVPATPISGEFS